MWYKFALTYGDDNQAEEQYSTNPNDITNQPVALNVPGDVQQKADKFASTGKPMFFTALDGQKYLVIHGTPDGYFNTGEPAVNSTDGNASNDGFVTREGLGAWIASKGWGGSVHVIACFGGKMQDLTFGGGTASSYFGNKGEIGYSTMTNTDGTTQMVFQQ